MKSNDKFKIVNNSTSPNESVKKMNSINDVIGF